MLWIAMSDDKPNPFEDVRKGLGLLFRAARTTVERMPRKNLEEVVMTSAREVGRAIENVGRTIEREVLGHKDSPSAASQQRGPHEGEGEHPSAGGTSHDGADGARRDDASDGPKPPDAA